MTSGEAAKVLSVDPSTLARWAREGLISPATVTAGGHRRWDLDKLRDEVAKLARDREQRFPKSS